ncbi:hypothetical protein SteCoe_769 [Stentor coeruleus]|uniref:Uncharacterized protein n=1 Tax=Stentor coeruleus TaxID=5963 RepID=A0A1R2D365_9CILI|nr:hypothetical protein SteCoe_769 [Stentor coeruleus]
MQYSIKVSTEAKFKFNDYQNEVVEEQAEESKSQSSSEDSSLVTEEDSSGKPLPLEILKIRKRNKQLQKDLTTGLMNFKSSSRSFINSSDSIEDFEPSYEEPVRKYEPMVKVEAMTVVNNNQKLKGMLDQIVRLQYDYEHAKKELTKNEQDIFETENEFLNLKNGLQYIQEQLQMLSAAKVVNSSCSCLIM